MAQYDILELYPTNKCQMTCSGCYLRDCDKEWSEERTKKILDSGIFKRVEKEVNILGGEPTTWKYLIDFIYALRRENEKIKISVTTNAIRFISDKEYFEEFIECCEDNKVFVNVSWHSNTDIIHSLYTLKKKGLLSSIIFVPNTYIDLKELETTYKKMSTVFHCVWRPFISVDNKYPALIKNCLNFLKTQSKKSIQSGRRLVCRKMEDNVDVLLKHVDNQSFYKSYECKSGKNGVIFVDGKLYHCLSQALKNDKPISLSNTKEIKWRKCNYDFCCCDTFELKDKKEEK